MKLVANDTKDIAKNVCDALVDYGIGFVGGCLISYAWNGKASKISRLAAIAAAGVIGVKITLDLSKSTYEIDVDELSKIIYRHRPTK